MISKIGVENRKINNIQNTASTYSQGNMNPNFKGSAAWALALQGIQECEKNPMINVAVIDMLSAILPRTIVESTTNWFAGFEAFRRESSGLIVNCLIPSFITMGIASILNKFIMPKGTNMASCWADSSLIKRTAEIYSSMNADDKIKGTLKELIGNISGHEGMGGKEISFNEKLSSNEIDEIAEKLKELTTAKKTNKEFRKEIKDISNEMVKKTHIFENIRVKGNGEPVKASTVTTLLEDSVKYLKEFQKTGKDIGMNEYAKKSMALVKSKSVLGLAVVLPLAISMQYINRWITGKLSGVKGAPIYEDYGKQNSVQDKKSQEGLLKQKIISISSMIGVSLLSMMKMPSFNMLEFKGIFPTMDQARIISTATFASRMAAADDKNELAEATVRDITTFSSLYFLGDYAAKAAATIIQNKTGVELLNETKKLDPDTGILKKFWHWVKDVHTKSSEEVVSKTAKELEAKGLTPDSKQAAKIESELKHAVNLRSACQVTNVGVSLLLLGLIIPIFTRKNTKKKHAEAVKQAQENSSSNVDERGKNEPAVTPLNVEYSKLTAGFRADRRQR